MTSISWQDLVITICNLVFAISLIPQIYLGFKNKKGYIAYATSVPTFVGVFLIGVAYLTLGLYFSTFMAFTSSAFWLTLFLQRLVWGQA